MPRQKSDKAPANLTLSLRVIEMAKAVMELRAHTSMSAFVEELIRDEFERRKGRMEFIYPEQRPSSSPKPRGVAAASKRAAARVGLEVSGQKPPTREPSAETLPPSKAAGRV